jgi:hypothetical protein
MYFGQIRDVRNRFAVAAPPVFSHFKTKAPPRGITIIEFKESLRSIFLKFRISA